MSAKLINIDREPPMVLNLDDIDTKRRLMTHIGTLKGHWYVELRPRQRNRSNDANRYYFGAIVRPFRDYLREMEGNPLLTTEQAHTTLKCHLLDSKGIVNEATGEVLTVVPTTRNMTVEEFGVYIDLATKFMAEFCGIAVMSSQEYTGVNI